MKGWTIVLILFLTCGCAQSDAVDIPPEELPPATGEPDIPITTSFEECAKYYPVMESYPMKCRDPVADKTFTQVIEPEWSVGTISAECATGEPQGLDIRAEGNSIVITAAMETSTPCYDVTAKVTLDGSGFLVEIGTEGQGGMCIECIGKVVGKVTISDLLPGTYSVDVRTPDQAAITTIMIQ